MGLGRGFASGFLMGVQGARQGIDVYNQAKDREREEKKRAELEAIANAQAIESTGFTEDQGAQLRAVAESGQYDIGIKTKEDGTFDSYTVTPKADPSQTGTMAMQGVTDFMGKRTAGQMTQDQQDSARQMAMAGVLTKYNPQEGMRMRRDVKNQEREDVKWDRQVNEWETADADKAALRQVDTEVGEWFKGRLANPDGTMREATQDDHAAASQFRASRLMQAGRTQEAGQAIKEYGDFAMKQIQLQEAQRNQALGTAAAALARGSFEGVKDFYNRFTPDGAQVTNITRGKSGEIIVERATDDGQPLPPYTLKGGTGELSAALNMFKDPMALYNWSQNEFRNNLALRADNRAQTQFNQGQEDRKTNKADKAAEADARVAIYKENNPNATPAQIEAVRRGVIDAVPTADKNAPSEVKLAKAMVDAGLAPDMRTGLEMAITKKSQSPREAYLDLMKPSGGMMPNEEDVAKVMVATFGSDWRDKVAGPDSKGKGGQNNPPKVNSPEELAKLPKGARYTAPDGSVRIKQ